MSFPQEELIFNGLDATTGGYLTQATQAELVEAARLAQDQTSDDHRRALHLRHSQTEHAGINADPRNLDETGWGVIFHKDADPRIREALAPLLNMRRAQAGPRYMEFSGSTGYYPGETKQQFAARRSAPVTGPVDPDRIPYYLLIVGSPATIPFDFQYQLDVQYAVGRIHFDTLEEYTRYAQAVVQAEQQRPALPRRATFFGVKNPNDKATIASAEKLIVPLASDQLPASIAESIRRAEANIQRAQQAGRTSDVERNTTHLEALREWQITTLLADQCYKDNLAAVLGGNDTPALLFTASHGVGFPVGHARQISDQGGLVCQDWEGPGRGLPAGMDTMPRAWYFSAADVAAASDLNLLGTIAFFFACYGGGTPQFDEFSQLRHLKEIAPRPFLARLPNALLTHPAGGALAVVAHVERAWGYSFLYEQVPQLNTFKDTLSNLMLDGYPLGACLEWFNQRYAETATELTHAQEQKHKFGNIARDTDIARLWTTHNDARSYVILGDPAVRLKVAGSGNQPRPRYTLAPYDLPVTGAPTEPLPLPTPTGTAEPQGDAPTPSPAPAPAPPAPPAASGLPAATMDAARRAVQMLGLMLADEQFNAATPIVGAVLPVAQPDGSTAVQTTLRDAAGYDLEITIVARRKG